MGKYTRPVLVHYDGNFEEVAIDFIPLDVNHFIRKNLIDIARLRKALNTKLFFKDIKSHTSIYYEYNYCD